MSISLSYKSNGAYKATSDYHKSTSEDNPKEVTNEELGLMVQNFNKMNAKNKFKTNDWNYSISRNESLGSRLREWHCYNCG